MDIIDSEQLLEALELEQIEKNIYRGQNHDIGAHHVFGGQVLTQSLHAAQLTVPQDRFVHSMHGYFILPGDLNAPIIYMIDEVRDGGSFSTRRVKGVQYGKDIFITAISFQLQQDGFDHQIEMPAVEKPDQLLSDSELVANFKDQLPAGAERFFVTRPIEFRPLRPIDYIARKKSEPLRHVWFRTRGSLPDDPVVHQRILAYASDYNLLTTSLLPHQHEVNFKRLQMASIDHAMWFHRPFRADEWLLYAIDSPSASGARGFNRGSIFKEDGTLVASVVQEGLLRQKTK